VWTSEQTSIERQRKTQSRIANDGKASAWHDSERDEEAPPGPMQKERRRFNLPRKRKKRTPLRPNKSGGKTGSGWSKMIK